MNLSSAVSAPYDRLLNSLRKSDFEYCERLGVDPMVPVAIAGVESGWTPWILRVNSSKRIKVEAEGIKRIAPNVFKCTTREKCEALALILVRKGLRNIDLGMFQFNYYHQKKKDFSFSIYDAFDLRRAYRRACRIVATNFKVQGRTANAVALYHSSKPWRNYKYAVRFWKIYLKLKGEK